jgi:membrane-bound lytic murein transglycosylase D
MKNQNKSKIHLALLYILLIIMLLSFISFTPVLKSKDNDGAGNLEQEYKIVAPEIPNNLFFAGERIPLPNFDVRERLERELVVNTFWHSASILNIKKANRWLPVIEEILNENNIPDDFKYMPIVESNLSNVISDKGATGFWQLMSGAAKKYGLEVNRIVDERYHVEKSTEAACKYLKEAYDKFGSWTTAAASYNMGMNGMAEQIERQKTNNYYNLVLNEETSRFVFRIVAARELIENPETYGFVIDEDELYPPYETETIKIGMEVKHFADFAKQYGINYQTLKLFNPWLRENYLPNKNRKTYEIKIPVEGSIYIIPDDYK